MMAGRKEGGDNLKWLILNEISIRPTKEEEKRKGEGHRTSKLFKHRTPRRSNRSRNDTEIVASSQAC
jgi:hypothetical protein